MSKKSKIAFLRTLIDYFEEPLMKGGLIKNPNRSRAAGYFLILLGINIAVELLGMVPKQEIKVLYNYYP